MEASVDVAALPEWMAAAVVASLEGELAVERDNNSSDNEDGGSNAERARVPAARVVAAVLAFMRRHDSDDDKGNDATLQAVQGLYKLCQGGAATRRGVGASKGLLDCLASALGIHRPKVVKIETLRLLAWLSDGCHDNQVDMAAHAVLVGILQAVQLQGDVQDIVRLGMPLVSSLVPHCSSARMRALPQELYAGLLRTTAYHNTRPDLLALCFRAAAACAESVVHAGARSLVADTSLAVVTFKDHKGARQEAVAVLGAFAAVTSLAPLISNVMDVATFLAACVAVVTAHGTAELHAALASIVVNMALSGHGSAVEGCDGIMDAVFHGLQAYTDVAEVQAASLGAVAAVGSRRGCSVAGRDDLCRTLVHAMQEHLVPDDESADDTHSEAPSLPSAAGKGVQLPASVRVQYEALTAAAVLARATPATRKELAASVELWECAVDAMEAHPQRVEVQRAALGAIGEAVKSQESVATLAAMSPLLELVVAAQRRFVEDVQIQRLACGIVWDTALEAANRVRVGAVAGIVDAVVDGLRQHEHDEELTRLAAGALYLFGAPNTDNAEQLADRLDAVMERVVHAARQFPSSPAVHKLSWRLLPVLMGATTQLRIVAIDGVLPALAAALAAMSDAPDGIEALTACGKAFVYLSYRNRNVQDLMAATEGMREAVLKAVVPLNDAEEYKVALAMLTPFKRGQDWCDCVLQAPDVMRFLCTLMSCFDEPEVAMEAMAAIICLLPDDDGEDDDDDEGDTDNTTAMRIIQHEHFAANYVTALLVHAGNANVVGEAMVLAANLMNGPGTDAARALASIRFLLNTAIRALDDVPRMHNAHRVAAVVWKEFIDVLPLAQVQERAPALVAWLTRVLASLSEESVRYALVPLLALASKPAVPTDCSDLIAALANATRISAASAEVCMVVEELATHPVTRDAAGSHDMLTALFAVMESATHSADTAANAWDALRALLRSDDNARRVREHEMALTSVLESVAMYSASGYHDDAVHVMNALVPLTRAWAELIDDLACTISDAATTESIATRALAVFLGVVSRAMDALPDPRPAYNAVCAALARFPDSHDVARMGVGALHNLTTSLTAASAERLESHDVRKVLEHTMAPLWRHADDPTVRCNALNVMWDIAGHVRIHAEIVRCPGLLQLVVQVLDEHPDDSQLHAAALYILENLFMSDDLVPPVMDVPGMLNVFTRTVARHAGSPDVLLPLFGAARNLASDLVDMRLKLGLADGFARGLVDGLIAHPTKPDLQAQGYNAVANFLCTASLRVQFTAHDGIWSHMLGTMRLHRENEVVLRALMAALTSLVYAGTLGGRLLELDADTVQACFVHVLTHFHDNDSLLSLAVSALWNLCLFHHPNVAIIASHKPLLDAFGETFAACYSKPTIARALVGVLSSLALHDAKSRRVVGARREWLDTLVLTLRSHAADANMQRLCVETVGNLCYKCDANATAAANVDGLIDACVAAVRAHSGDADLLHAAVISMTALVVYDTSRHARSRLCGDDSPLANVDGFRIGDAATCKRQPGFLNLTSAARATRALVKLAPL